MKRFVKNNLVLIVVLSLSFIAAVVLLVWTALEHSEMSRYAAQLTKLRSDIKVLIDKTPAPVKENIPLIEVDQKSYAKAAWQIRRKFGHPLLPALLGNGKDTGFFAKLNPKTTLNKLRQELRDELAKYESFAQQGVAYKEYQLKYKNWNEAMQEFRRLAQPLTAERITDSNVDEIFLLALGVPRNLQQRPERLSSFLRVSYARLHDLLSEGNIEVRPEVGGFGFELGLSSEGGASTGTVGQYAPEEYANITQQWEIIGDLVRRIAKSGVRSLNFFKPRALAPEQVGDFLVYHYSFEVSGPLSKVRTLVQSLDSAISQNRVYVVRSIFLYAADDPLRALVDPVGAKAEAAKLEQETSQGPRSDFFSSRRRGRAPMPVPTREGMSEAEALAEAEMLRKKQEEEEMKRPYYERSTYGKPLTGGEQDCRAIIDVDYVMEATN